MFRSVFVILLCVMALAHGEEVKNLTEETTEADEDSSEHDAATKESAAYCGKCLCGERNEASRIVGGADAGVSEFPWLVRLSYSRRSYCGGALLNSRHVLTAAHCVKGLMWFMIRVTLGEHDRCDETRRPPTRYVQRVTAHDFSFSHFRNDIALLLLSAPVAISDVIKPICLPHDDEPSYEGTKAIVAGWGSTNEKNNGSCVLQEVELPVLSNAECRGTKYKPDMISDSMLCAGYPETGQKDSCQGDSGGPLTAERKRDKRYELLGVVSWGIGCARAGYPGVYTRVTKYLYWMRHHARPGCYCTD